MEFATLEWVGWFNNRRLLEPLGDRPPAQAEGTDYRQQEHTALAADDDISKIKIIPNLSMSFRVRRLGRRVLAKGLSIAGKDHRIDEYREKLKRDAEKRRPD